jgi:hypothetical protein
MKVLPFGRERYRSLSHLGQEGSVQVMDIMWI